MAVYRGERGNKIPVYPHLRQLFPRLFPRFSLGTPPLERIGENMSSEYTKQVCKYNKP